MSHFYHFYAHEQSDLDWLRQAEIIPSSVQTIQTSLTNLNKLRLNVDPKTSNEKKIQELPDVYLTDIKPQTLHLFLGFYSFFFRFQTVLSASQSSFDLRINSPDWVWGLQISESSINQIIFIFLEIQSKWNHRVDNGDECEAAPLCERVNSFQTRADAEIWLRSGLRNRAACRSSWWWAALCSSPVTVYCTSLSGTSVSGLWRKGYSQVTEFYDKTKPATANVPLCVRLQSANDPYFSVFKRNKPSCWLFPQTRTSRITWRIYYSAGNHSIPH